MRAHEDPVAARRVLTGPQSGAPLQGLRVRVPSPEFWSFADVVQMTDLFRQVTLTPYEIWQLTIAEPTSSFACRTAWHVSASNPERVARGKRKEGLITAPRGDKLRRRTRSVRAHSRPSFVPTV